MICPPCRITDHQGCPGRSWCDCQHKPPPYGPGSPHAAVALLPGQCVDACGRQPGCPLFAACDQIGRTYPPGAIAGLLAWCRDGGDGSPP